MEGSRVLLVGDGGSCSLLAWPGLPVCLLSSTENCAGSEAKISILSLNCRSYGALQSARMRGINQSEQLNAFVMQRGLNQSSPTGASSWVLLPRLPSEAQLSLSC